MRTTLLAALVLLSSHAAVAVDLTKIDRTIAKEPQYATKQPRYGLLVFGPKAADRVWLVQDGDTLYVDRNGNGDLTEPGEKIAMKVRKESETGMQFQVGDLTLGGKANRNLKIFFEPLTQYQGWGSVHKQEIIQKAIATDASGLAASFVVDVASDHFKGNGVGGRIVQLVGPCDLSGVLQFATRPPDAPVIHLDGPLVITFSSQPIFIVDRASQAIAAVGTSGLGAGTFAQLGYEGTIAKDANPVLKITFPPAVPGAKPVTQQYELGQRCCTTSLYNSIRLPPGTPTASAKAVLSFDGWTEGLVKTSAHKVEVVLPRNLVRVPVSPRLLRTLPHPEKTACLTTIRFTPNGRLFAAGYPSGIVQMFDPTTGKELRRIETPKGLRGSADYALATSDFRSLYKPLTGDTVVEFEKDGEQRSRRDYNGRVLAWDLETGKPRPSLEPGPGWGVTSSFLSPGGSWLVSVEYTTPPGSEERKCSSVLWDLKTGIRKPLGNQYAMAAFSKDEKTLVLTLFGDEVTNGKLVVLDPATGKERFSVTTKSYGRGFSWPLISPDEKIVAITHSSGQLKDPGSTQFYDLITGGKLAEFETGETSPVKTRSFSPDGKKLAAVTYNDKLMIWDAATLKPIRQHSFERYGVYHLTFSPDSRTLAIIGVPKNELVHSYNDVEPDLRNVPQMRVFLFAVESNVPPEVLIGPPCLLGDLTFDKTGKILAVGGAGGVHLFDVSNTPAR